MIETKQSIGFWKLFIIFLIVIFFIALLTSSGEPQTQTSTQSSTPAYTAENCIHDLALQNANAVKRDIENGVPFSETKEINRLSEYERQKSECYKNY